MKVKEMKVKKKKIEKIEIKNGERWRNKCSFDGGNGEKQRIIMR